MRKKSEKAARPLVAKKTERPERRRSDDRDTVVALERWEDEGGRTAPPGMMRPPAARESGR
jgi:hypothetical protein